MCGLLSETLSVEIQIELNFGYFDLVWMERSLQYMRFKFSIRSLLCSISHRGANLGQFLFDGSPDLSSLGLFIEEYFDKSTWIRFIRHFSSSRDLNLYTGVWTLFALDARRYILPYG